eukprot:CAMPEP_0206186550 /NCGR_PEP_ID=MMETSP0166-20121206/2467_1 /ASSEMBLY_ACC=CAM_ASM_000260 /TAXON_ID=95228 /ORGANISM="Vannella robusta, Strain DIVA3 518/3/11/1/6" /LENGTH=310 /DNA_ID=CAMNT_0053601951 /DNA_START=1205 /DNA_END=2137 /DNA_ORIENTATION=+
MLCKTGGNIKRSRLELSYLLMAELVKTTLCFGGKVQKWKHKSSVLGDECNEMVFSTYLPPGASADAKVPVIYWLSGLTCTDENFITKAAAQRMAAELGVALVCPDTSPRGCNIEGEDENWDFGTGAGFYVNATADKWKKNYNMFSYVTEELPSIVAKMEEIDASNCSIMGHSMGGHGSLICSLKNPGKYKSTSAFSPICNPVNCPWGKKAFGGYLGDNEEEWKQWDATELARNASEDSWKAPLNILIDQGTADNFLSDKQLLPENFQEACNSKSFIQAEVRMQEGYDHSYYFIQTFINDHLQFHAKYLKQ